MEWVGFIRRLRRRNVEVAMVGKTWYLRDSRGKTKNDWTAEMGNIRFSVLLEEKKGLCTISSTDILPDDLNKAIKDMLKYPVGAMGLHSDRGYKYRTVIIQSQQLLDYYIETNPEIVWQAI